MNCRCSEKNTTGLRQWIRISSPNLMIPLYRIPQMQDFPTSPVPRSWLTLHWSSTHWALLTGKRTSSQIKAVESVEHDSMSRCKMQDVMTLADRNPSHSFPLAFIPSLFQPWFQANYKMKLGELKMFGIWAAWGAHQPIEGQIWVLPKDSCENHRLQHFAIFWLKHAESMASTWTMQLQWERWIQLNTPSQQNANNHQNIRMGTNPHMTCFWGWHWWMLWDWNPQVFGLTNLWNAKDGNARHIWFWVQGCKGIGHRAIGASLRIHPKTHPRNSGNRKRRQKVSPSCLLETSCLQIRHAIFRIYLLVCGMWITPIDWYLAVLHCPQCWVERVWWSVCPKKH